jgi:hypothetical protein
MSSNLKLSFKWLRLYRVKEANTLKRTYTLKEVDRTLLKGIYIRNRLKKFVYKKDTFILINQEAKTNSTKPNILKESNS